MRPSCSRASMRVSVFSARAESSPIPPDQVSEAVHGIEAAQYLGVVLATLLLYDIGERALLSPWIRSEAVLSSMYS